MKMLPDDGSICQHPDGCVGDPAIHTEDLGDTEYLCEYHHAEALRFNDYEWEAVS